jgi:uncharacterized protein YciI
MFYVVLRRRGPEYDHSKPLEEQVEWPEHAAFMEALVDSGFVVLGGPLADEDRVVLAIEAESADAVRATLAEDPWSERLLVVEAVEPWTIRLDGGRARRDAGLRAPPRWRALRRRSSPPRAASG